MKKSWEDDWKKAPGNSKNHYEGEIQPVEYFASDFKKTLSANVEKYVFRHKKKDGRVDLEKARWYVDWLRRSLDYPEIHAGDFIAANNFEEEVAELILLIEEFEEVRESDKYRAYYLLDVVDAHIVSLIEKYYGE